MSVTQIIKSNGDFTAFLGDINTDNFFNWFVNNHPDFTSSDYDFIQPDLIPSSITDMNGEIVDPSEEAVDEIAESQLPELEGAEEATPALTTALEAGEAVTSSVFDAVNPFFIMAQAAGAALNSALISQYNSNIQQQYVKDVSAGGMQSELHASIYQAFQTGLSSNANLGGTIGSLLGPLGTVFGEFLGSTFSSNFDQSALDTGYSPTGAINPDDVAVSVSANSDTAQGQDVMFANNNSNNDNDTE